MSKSVLDLVREAKLKYCTINNTFEMFPVGTRVKVIVPEQDFCFFYGETGTVIRNKGIYLSIIVKFDKPRIFQREGVQTEFGFNPDDLILWKEEEDGWKVSEKITVTDRLKEFYRGEYKLIYIPFVYSTFGGFWTLVKNGKKHGMNNLLSYSQVEKAKQWADNLISEELCVTKPKPRGHCPYTCFHGGGSHCGLEHGPCKHWIYPKRVGPEPLGSDW